ncbi:MAG TPA: EamA family transporter, partial [Propionibacteriaceae bacterium]|nr:EamA family transporter [Propionibacteriaceae bacterium]
MTSEVRSLLRSPRAAIWLVLGSIASVQVGAAFAKGLFGEVTPTSMAWLRLLTASLILLAFWAVRVLKHRPSLRPAVREPRNWRVVLAWSLCLVTMNWAIYESFSRIPLGIAVTIEFLGPLAVAVLGSRRLVDLVWVALAGSGVALLGFAPSSPTLAGVGFALLAGAGWAGYIVLGSHVGRTWPSLDALTVGCVLGAVALAPWAIAQGGTQLWRPGVLAVGLAIGLLSSVIPYGLELTARKSLPPALFGILMSL